MLSRDLEVTLNLAFKDARVKRHELMSVEHLLLALIDNEAAAEVLRACGAEIEKLRKELVEFRRAHDAFHMGEREHFDKACMTSIKNPKDMWVIIADGATQRNFGAFHTCSIERQCRLF